MNSSGRVNTLFLCIFGVSLIVHIVALAYIKLPELKQTGSLAISLVMKQKPKPRPPRPEPEPEPEPKPEPRPVAKNRVQQRQEPRRVQEMPPPPLKPQETPREVSMTPVAPVVVDVPPGASEHGAEHGQQGGIPGGKGREPVVEPPPRRDPPPVQPPPPRVDLDALWRQYAVKVIGRIQSAKQYPARAKRQGITGAASVRFTVSASGAVSGVGIAGSSGQPILDEEAVNAVHRAAPFPPIPPELNASSKTMSVTLKFEIR